MDIREIKEIAAEARRINRAFDLVKLAKKHTKLTRVDDRFIGNCPLHSNKGLEFFVHPKKKLFHCSGCKVGGDVISFLLNIEGLTRSEITTLTKEILSKKRKKK